MREQKLVDIMFQIAAVTLENSERFKGIGHEKHMEWVAEQLKNCGFPTKPIGSSWGVLTNG